MKPLPRQARERREGGEKDYGFQAAEHAKSAILFYARRECTVSDWPPARGNKPSAEWSADAGVIV
jgi:hypothetical protein